MTYKYEKPPNRHPRTEAELYKIGLSVDRSGEFPTHEVINWANQLEDELWESQKRCVHIKETLKDADETIKWLLKVIDESDCDIPSNVPPCALKIGERNLNIINEQEGEKK